MNCILTILFCFATSFIKMLAPRDGPNGPIPKRKSEKSPENPVWNRTTQNFIDGPKVASRKAFLKANLKN